MLRHPRAALTSSGIVAGEIEFMPILGRTKPFLMMNESTVCTVDTVDQSGARRGAIALGFSKHGMETGTVIYQSIDEAEGMIDLVRKAIDDARRIEAGEAPRAPVAPPPGAH